jgi:hypothetical protein
VKGEDREFGMLFQRDADMQLKVFADVLCSADMKKVVVRHRSSRARPTPEVHLGSTHNVHKQLFLAHGVLYEREVTRDLSELHWERDRLTI